MAIIKVIPPIIIKQLHYQIIENILGRGLPEIHLLMWNLKAGLCLPWHKQCSDLHPYFHSGYLWHKVHILQFHLFDDYTWLSPDHGWENPQMFQASSWGICYMRIFSNEPLKSLAVSIDLASCSLADDLCNGGNTFNHKIIWNHSYSHSSLSPTFSIA